MKTNIQHMIIWTALGIWLTLIGVLVSRVPGVPPIIYLGLFFTFGLIPVLLGAAAGYLICFTHHWHKSRDVEFNRRKHIRIGDEYVG